LIALGLWPTVPLPIAVGAIALLGATGTTYAVLMAHGRSFLPDHLLGRGITLLNFTFMVGAAVVQLLSGRAVDTMTAAGRTPQDVFATLHLGFGLALLAVTLIYLGARDSRKSV
jgi:hypothetical protein